jgi:hypothetical protein
MWEMALIVLRAIIMLVCAFSAAFYGIKAIAELMQFAHLPLQTQWHVWMALAFGFGFWTTTGR